MAAVPSPCCSVEYPDQPMCCDLSPDRPLLAVGLITGDVHLHSYTYTSHGGAQPADVSAKLQRHLSPHPHDGDDDVQHSCRAVRWMPGSQQVVSGAADKCVVATSVETGKQAWRVAGAHDAGVSVLRVLPGIHHSEGVVVSGDEDGGLKIWDLRTKKQAMSYKKHKDFISDIRLHERDTALVVSSGDGTLSVHDLRAMKFRARSEADADDDLLSLVVMKGGKKVVAGSGSGVLAIYSWGYFNDCSDRFPGHPESVDALVAWDDSTVLTGSSDGLVRAIHILPNKLLGVIGAHEEMPIENMELSHDRHLLASTSHDTVVRLWDLALLQDEEEGEEGEGEEGEGEGEEEQVEQGMEGSDGDNASSEEGEVGEGEEEEGEDDEDEEEEGEKGRGAVKGVMQGSGTGEDEDEDVTSGSDSDAEGEDGAESDVGDVSKVQSDANGTKTGLQSSKAAQGDEGTGVVVGKGGQGLRKKQGKGKGKGDAGTEVKMESEVGQSQGVQGAEGVQGSVKGKVCVQEDRSGGKETVKQPAAGPVAGGSSDSDADSDDSDEGGRGPKGKKGKRQREKTRWIKEKNKKPANEFWAGLL